MKKFFRNFILDEKQMDETFDLISISLPNTDFFQLLTSDYDGETESFYLFNKVKIWQKTNKDENEPRKNKFIMTIVSLFLLLTIPFGIAYKLYNYETDFDDSSIYKLSKIQWYELSMRTKIKTIIKSFCQ